jgi:hypothetical protein
MTSYPIDDSPEEQHHNPWLVRLPLLFITGGALLVLLLVIFVGVVQSLFSASIMPGVWSNGINLGGMTRVQASAALDKWFTYDEDAIFTFRDGDRFWQYTAGELGVSLDVDATVEQALSAGHSANFLFNLVEQASIWFNGPPLTAR